MDNFHEVIIMSSPDEMAVSEIDLYRTDRAAWIVAVSPKMAKMIEESDDPMLRYLWSMMKRDYQKTVWELLNESQRERIRKLRGKS